MCLSIRFLNKQVWVIMSVHICMDEPATLAAAQQLADCGWIQPGEDVVLFNCATGLKYPLPD